MNLYSLTAHTMARPMPIMPLVLSILLYHLVPGCRFFGCCYEPHRESVVETQTGIEILNLCIDIDAADADILLNLTSRVSPIVSRILFKACFKSYLSSFQITLLLSEIDVLFPNQLGSCLSHSMRSFNAIFAPY